MDICKSCEYQWSYKESLKMLGFKRGVKCPNCGQKQYLTTESIWYGSMLFILIYFFAWIPLRALYFYYDLPLVLIIVIAVILLFIPLLLWPKYMKLSNKEEPLF
ncbi:TIGR04104 family putative zinc finger protein [Halalkalibacillus halophilus]|uniref:TIGR04104 family putative zinc finger protein n=1 Tax=Halalkalibacillus halophilus TaxID=392827 RepID=UPI0005541E91|nr:TIGR04104 family putative zinc finger protein [Halalkalibacillus halophilus]